MRSGTREINNNTLREKHTWTMISRGKIGDRVGRDICKIGKGEAAVGNCCPLIEGGKPNPEGAIWFISGKGDLELMNVKQSILNWVPCGGAPFGV